MNDHRVRELGYIGLEVSDLTTWQEFAQDVVGLEAAGRDEGGAALFRMDGEHHRVALEAGCADDLSHAGWMVEDAASMVAIGERLLRHGARVQEGSPSERARRGVAGLLRTEDPDGTVHEVAWGSRAAAEPFVPGRQTAGFVAGSHGLGHIVLNVSDLDASLGFFRDCLGMRITDYIDVDTGEERPTTVVFLHCGPRHHSLALAPFPGTKRLHHVMFQVEDLDDVGTAYDRCVDRAVPIAATLGRHTNDRMTSFYAVTPSGFQMEYGHGGIEVDDDTWEVRTFSDASMWGHRSPAPV